MGNDVSCGYGKTEVQMSPKARDHKLYSREGSEDFWSMVLAATIQRSNRSTVTLVLNHI